MNTAFSRAVLTATLKDVKALDRTIKLREAWVWKCGRDHWEFHFHDYFWHGSATDAYDARAKGWSAYMESKGAPGYERELEEQEQAG